MTKRGFALYHMQYIALPKNYFVEKGEDEKSAKIVIEPCFPGYGITLGNSLRRVLLSSLPGAAVVGAKIEGVDHEFMAVPHVKEDVLEILMNLKQLRLKILGEEETVKLQLKASGQKVVTAADITKDASVEIINKDLEIANITAMAGKLNIEIAARKGLGYETIETRAGDNKEIGYIEIDSIFSPVLSVGVKIENVRVGKMTNWDKLIIDLKTDGSITPEDAFKYANNILIEQFKALDAISSGSEAVSMEAVEEKNDEDSEMSAAEDVAEEDTEPSEEKKARRGRPKKS